MSSTPYPVLFLIQHLDQGGTERHFHDLVLGLDHQTIRPLVMHFGDRDGLMARALAARPEVPTRFVPVSRAYSPSAAMAGARVARTILRRRVACVVTFHFVADFIGTTAARLTRTPVISSRRDMGFTRTTRQLRLGRHLSRGVARYIAVSGAVKAAVVRDEGVDPHRVTVIHNGIDLTRYADHGLSRAAERVRLGLPDDAVVVGSVANFNPVKGHVTLVEAFARLVTARGDQGPPVWLVLAGDGPLREVIERRIAALGLQDRVVLAGLSHDARRELLASDVFVLPSETEGFSNAIVQAMALARPVVACDVGGNPEAVAAGETGLLVPARDPEAMARALELLVADPGARKRMGEAGARRAREMFRFDTMVARTQGLITEVIGHHRRPLVRGLSSR